MGSKEYDDVRMWDHEKDIYMIVCRPSNVLKHWGSVSLFQPINFLVHLTKF